MYNIRECTNWPLYLFVPMAAKKSRLITSLVENKNVRILYINYVVFKGFKTLAYLFFKKNKAIIQSQNVLVTSLFLTVNMGYKKIELVGAEHSWHEELRVNDDNLVCMKHVHFYEKDSEIKLIPFYKSRHKHETFYMHEIFIVWAKVFYGHVQVNSYANSRGSKIYNASETSYIDAYERIKL